MSTNFECKQKLFMNKMKKMGGGGSCIHISPTNHLNLTNVKNKIMFSGCHGSQPKFHVLSLLHSKYIRCQHLE